VVAPYATDVSTSGTELEMLNEKMNALSQVELLLVPVLVLVLVVLKLAVLGKNVIGK
jgi:ABC-type dipeptide/oligopeptide/nickel transport system permease subunit